MKKRAFWLMSLVLVLSAISLHLAALGKAQNGVRTFSQAMNVNTEKKQKEKLKTEASQFYKVADTFRFAGIAAAILSLGCLIYSYKKDEPAIRPIAIILLAFYLLLQFAVV